MKVTSPLENLCGPNGPLSKERPDAKELAGLEQSGLTRLADAEKTANSLESRFDLGYKPPTRCALARCGARGTARESVTSCFNCCRTPSVSVPRCGECLLGATIFGTAVSTKVTRRSTSAWSPI